MKDVSYMSIQFCLSSGLSGQNPYSKFAWKKSHQIPPWTVKQIDIDDLPASEQWSFVHVVYACFSPSNEEESNLMTHDARRWKVDKAKRSCSALWLWNSALNYCAAPVAPTTIYELFF